MVRSRWSMVKRRVNSKMKIMMLESSNKRNQTGKMTKTKKINSE